VFCPAGTIGKGACGVGWVIGGVPPTPGVVATGCMSAAINHVPAWLISE
jgi:hypothetical protein